MREGFDASVAIRALVRVRKNPVAAVRSKAWHSLSCKARLAAANRAVHGRSYFSSPQTREPLAAGPADAEAKQNDEPPGSSHATPDATRASSGKSVQRE